MELFGHPFSSYTWKALIALFETGAPFTLRNLDPSTPDNHAELKRRWPVGTFPVLVDGDIQVMESTSIIEHLAATRGGGERLIPADPLEAREVRMLDRIFDNHVMNVMQMIVADRLLPAGRRDPLRVETARAKLDTIYGWLDERMSARAFACGDAFSMADCAAAPSLFYADWVHPNDGRFAALGEYRARLLARPSVARAVDGARPYRHYFPGGAPDRD